MTLPMKDYLPEMGLRHQLNPMELSEEERVFLLQHLQDSVAMALKGWDSSIPHNPTDEVPGANPEPVLAQCNPWCLDHPGVDPKTVKAVIVKLRDTEEVHSGAFGYYKRDASMAPLIGKEPDVEYHGLDAIRVAIEDSLEYERRLVAIRARDPHAALHPSMYTKDGRGRLHFQGVGSDRGMVRRFTCWIRHEETGQVDPQWAAAAVTDSIMETDAEQAEKVSGKGADYRLIEGDNYFECCVQGCNKRFTFDPEDAGDRRKRRSNLQSHYAMATKSPDDHREAKLVIFG